MITIEVYVLSGMLKLSICDYEQYELLWLLACIFKQDKILDRTLMQGSQRHI